jgi:type II secretory pathway component GspD/PulD (secretin)
MRTTTSVRDLRHMGVRLLAVGAAWSGLGLICSPVAAQHAPPAMDQMQRPVSIDATKTSLLTVVSQLMKQIHANYTVDAQLLDAPIGAIHLEKTPFRTALEVALKASGKPATYRFEAGVFMVVADTEQPAVSQSGAPPMPGQPGFMPGGAQAPAGQVKVSYAPGPSLEESRVNLDCQNADLYSALKAVFQQVKAQYTLDPSLRNVYITANIHQPFRNTLETLLRCSGQPLTYKLENDVYSIVPRSEDTTEAPAPDGANLEASKIKLAFDNVDLYTALKLLFAQAKTQFTLEPILKNYYVTIHINQPFRQALETLLRASGQSLTYKLENNVYSIVPKP